MKSKIRFPPAEGIARVFRAQFLARRRILLPRSPKRCGSVSAGGAAWLVVQTPRQEDRRRLCPWGEGLYRARPPGPSASVPNRQERQRSQMSARRDTFPVLKEYSFPPIHRESFKEVEPRQISSPKGESSLFEESYRLVSFTEVKWLDCKLGNFLFDSESFHCFAIRTTTLVQ